MIVRVWMLLAVNVDQQNLELYITHGIFVIENENWAYISLPY